MNTEPTAGALRAAEKILSMTEACPNVKPFPDNARSRVIETFAAFIDKETGLSEILKALETASRALSGVLPILREADQYKEEKEVEDAIKNIFASLPRSN